MVFTKILWKAGNIEIVWTWCIIFFFEGRYYFCLRPSGDMPFWKDLLTMWVKAIHIHLNQQNVSYIQRMLWSQRDFILAFFFLSYRGHSKSMSLNKSILLTLLPIMSHFFIFGLRPPPFLSHPKSWQTISWKRVERCEL